MAEPGLVERIRAAGFSTARKGYDRTEVDTFLGSIAERIERMQVGITPELEVDESGALKRELERIGERTKHILTAAEETAQQLRSEAAAKASDTRRAAETWANRVRGDAEEFANTTRSRVAEDERRQRLEAGQRAEEIVTNAEAKAEEMIEETARRRRQLEARLEALEERRSAILADARSLLDELSATLTAHEGAVAEAARDEASEPGAELAVEEEAADEFAEGAPFESVFDQDGFDRSDDAVEPPAELQDVGIEETEVLSASEEEREPAEDDEADEDGTAEYESR
jgi:DivIVA domain-containing protein